VTPAFNKFSISLPIIGGYSIPKGTLVIPNLLAIHFDKRYWDEPDKFKPGNNNNIKIDLLMALRWKNLRSIYKEHNTKLKTCK
jgi:hypothetical protein